MGVWAVTGSGQQGLEHCVQVHTLGSEDNTSPKLQGLKMTDSELSRLRGAGPQDREDGTDSSWELTTLNFS